MIDPNITLVVPTIGKRAPLTDLLDSLAKQTVLPNEIIIVNGSVLALDDLIQDYRILNIRILHCYPPGLTRQRNVGIAAISPQTNIVGFLDDDIIVQDGTLAAMVDFWKTAGDDVGGASFNIINDTFEPASLVQRVFNVNSNRRGRILRSGFNSSIASPEKTMRSEWLLGGATTWRRSVIEEFKFDEWYAGYALFEDVEYSYRVGKKYRLMVVSEARVIHNSQSVVRRDKEYSLGKMHVVNRAHFVKKHAELSHALFYWACFGLIVNNIVKSLARMDARYLSRALGNAAGIGYSLVGDSHFIKEQLK